MNMKDARSAGDADSNCQQLYRLAKTLIPGGTQLLSKRPELFAPDQWPAYYREAHGCEIVDLDGRTYVDMSYMGIGSCLLGYNDPDVNDAVVARVRAGSMCSLNNPEEVELAQLLLGIHPWAKAARFAAPGLESSEPKPVFEPLPGNQYFYCIGLLLQPTFCLNRYLKRARSNDLSRALC